MKGFVSCISGICSILLLACGQQRDGINRFVPVHVEGWHCQDTVDFDIPAVKQGQNYALWVKVRINRHYAYEDLWIVAEQTYSPTSEDGKSGGDRSLTDTVHMTLTGREREGNSLIVYICPVRRVQLDSGTCGQIRLHHIMDERCIGGVHDVGVELLPLEPIATGINAQHDEKEDGETPQR